MRTLIMIITLLTAFIGSSAYSEETKSSKQNNKAMSEITPERRQNMASMHEKMAECLRSEKPMNECQTEMNKLCQEMMGKDGCPMMGQMGGMMGRDMKSGQEGKR